MKKRVFSGIQPTGRSHIGNYLGAMKHWANDQREFENFFCIVDLHALTVPQDPAELRAATREMAAMLIAVGLDPRYCHIFVQSHVAAHSQMAWLLNCFTPLGWLERMTQYKDKAQKQVSVMAGLLGYPVLMAGDILLYHTHYVPVGDDQKQHVELARDIAQSFNARFGDVFTVPEVVIPPVGARIMNLSEPTKKMSKSDDDLNSTILLLDTPDAIRRKLMRATTDSERSILFDENRPGIYNLLTLYELFTGEPRAAIESRFAGKGYGDLKKGLAEVVIEGLRPLQARYAELTRDPATLDTILRDSAERCAVIAEKTLTDVQHVIGLR
ncbi:MAG: tryptophan--tRNA ligase [Chloroflexi bacterium]|nr:tryptophan--tRNA ligase [Chloroflexota bacterium]MBI3732851.1 tryptophan--tRNA ligase [Chloroflexota bacterium]